MAASIVAAVPVTIIFSIPAAILHPGAYLGRGKPRLRGDTGKGRIQTCAH